MGELMAHDLQMVILGTGDPKYHALLEGLAKRYPGKLALNLAFDNRLAHLIEAGSDMYLMPSQYEPCGLNQIYSLKYGSVPIVRETGGLKDTIVNVTDDTLKNATATGFSFRVYKSAALLEAVKRALALYARKGAWHDLVLAGMKQDWSWERSAREYLGLYDWAIKNRGKTGKAARPMKAGTV